MIRSEISQHEGDKYLTFNLTVLIKHREKSQLEKD